MATLVWVVLYVLLIVFLLYVAYVMVELLNSVRDIWRCLVVSRKLKSIPSPVSNNHWLYGSLKEYRPSTEKGLLMSIDWLASYPKYYSIKYGPVNRYVVVCHPDTVKPFLNRTRPRMMTKYGGWSFRNLKPWVGDSILVTSSLQKWHRNRRLLSPAFHLGILKDYVKVFNGCANDFLEKLFIKCKASENIDIIHFFGSLTLSSILQCAFGSNESCEFVQKLEETYRKNIRNIAEAVTSRNFNPLYMFDKIYFNTSDGKEFLKAVERSRSLPNKVLQERRNAPDQEPEASRRKARDFMDILLTARDENGQGLTDREILDEVETFMAGALDSTKSSLSFFLLNMARHQAIQEKVRAEIRARMRGRDNDDVTWDDLSALPYTAQCIKESLRLYPPFRTAGRELTEPMELDGHVLPAGTPVEINIWSVHHNPHVWGEDHMTFKPERFTDENMADMDPYSYIPFSAGPRNCIGQNFAKTEIKVVVAKILNKFKVDLVPERKYELSRALVLTIVRGMPLKFTAIEA